jgi:transmembrane sensor
MIEPYHSAMSHRPKSDDEARAEAARWFARVQAGEMDADERRALEDWRRRDSKNQREYEALERVWNTAQKIPAERLRALAEEPPKAAPKGQQRGASWRAPLAYAAGCSVVIAAALAAYSWYQAQPTFAVSLETARGERKRVSLPDGSMIEMNVSSRGDAGYYRARRAITLTTGEMLFTVERDPTRPFTIDAGNGKITVIGTRFNVRRDGDEVSVTVSEGTVEVSGRDNSARFRLTAGLGAQVDAAGRVQEPRPIDVTAVTAWRDGKLIFDGATLAEVVREVMRYRERPIRITDARIAQLRLSSIFSINDTDALLSALPKILPVEVNMLADGSVEIRGHWIQ